MTFTIDRSASIPGWTSSGTFTTDTNPSLIVSRFLVSNGSVRFCSVTVATPFRFSWIYGYVEKRTGEESTCPGSMVLSSVCFVLVFLSVSVFTCTGCTCTGTTRVEHGSCSRSHTCLSLSLEASHWSSPGSEREVFAVTVAVIVIVIVDRPKVEVEVKVTAKDLRSATMIDPVPSLQGLVGKSNPLA